MTMDEDTKNILKVGSLLLLVAFTAHVLTDISPNFVVAVGGFSFVLFFYAFYKERDERVPVYVTIIYFSTLGFFTGVMLESVWYMVMGLAGMTLAGSRYTNERKTARILSGI